MKAIHWGRWARVVVVALALFVVAPAVSAADPPGEDKVKPKPAETDDTPGSPPGHAVAPGGTPAGNNSALATLRVVVTGDGRPIERADVKISTPSGDGSQQLFTNENGEIRFKSSKLGKVKVRVIANEWESAQRGVTLVAGEQSLTIELIPLQ